MQRHSRHKWYHQMHRFYLHALLGRERGEASPHAEEEEEIIHPDSLKSLTDSAARHGKESIAHELVMFRYASNVLHRCFAALRSRRHRGAAVARLQGLRERMAAVSPDRVSRIVGLGISRLLATELMRKQRWKDCIQELNSAIYQCPLNSTRPMNGLSEALVLLAEAYAGADRFDEGIHSLCLAIDFAADQCEIDESPEISLGGPPGEGRIEGASEHYNYMTGMSAPGPHLSPGHSLVFGLYAVACWAHARGLREDAAQWFDRAMQTAQRRCTANVALLSGLNDTLSAAVQALSDNQRDVPIVSIDDAALARYYKWKQAFLSSRAPLHFMDVYPMTSPTRTLEPRILKSSGRVDLKRGVLPSPAPEGGAAEGADSRPPRERTHWAWRGSEGNSNSSASGAVGLSGPLEAAVEQAEKVEAAVEPLSRMETDSVGAKYGAQIDAIMAKLRKSMDQIYYEISVNSDIIYNFESRQHKLKTMFFARHHNSCRSVRLAKAHQRIRTSPAPSVVSSVHERGNNINSKRDILEGYGGQSAPTEDSELGYAVRVSAVRFRDEAASAMHSAADRFKLAALKGQVTQAFQDDGRPTTLTSTFRFAGIDMTTRAALAIQTATRRFLSRQLASELLSAQHECDEYGNRLKESQRQLKILFYNIEAILSLQKDGICRAVDLIDRKNRVQDSQMLVYLDKLRDLALRSNLDQYFDFRGILGGKYYDSSNPEFVESVSDKLASRIQFAYRRSRFQHRVRDRIARRNSMNVVTAEAGTSTIRIVLCDAANETDRLCEMRDLGTQCGDDNISLGGPQDGYCTEGSQAFSDGRTDSESEEAKYVVQLSDAACQSDPVEEEVALSAHTTEDAAMQTERVLVLHATSQTVSTYTLAAAAVSQLQRLAASTAFGSMLDALEMCTSIKIRRNEGSAVKSVKPVIALPLAAATDVALREEYEYAADEDFAVLGEVSKADNKALGATTNEDATDHASAVASLRIEAIAEAVQSVSAATNQRCPAFVGDNRRQHTGLAAAFIQAWDYYLALALTRLYVLLAVEEEAGRCSVNLVHSLLGTTPKSPFDAYSPALTARPPVDSDDLPAIRSVRRIVTPLGTGGTAPLIAECVHQAWALLKQEAAVRVAVVRALIGCAPKCSDESDAQSVRLFAQLQALDLCSRLRKVSHDLLDELRSNSGTGGAVEWSSHIRTASLAFRDLCLQLATLVANFRDAGLGDNNYTYAQKGGGTASISVLPEGEVTEAATAVFRAADLFDAVLGRDIETRGGGPAARVATALGLGAVRGEDRRDNTARQDFQYDMLVRSAAALVHDCASDISSEVFSKASALIASAQSSRPPHSSGAPAATLTGPAAEEVQRFSAALSTRLLKDVEARAPLLVMLH